MEKGKRPDRRSKKLGKRCVKSADRVGVQKSRKIISQEMKALDNAHIEGLITKSLCFTLFFQHKLFLQNFLPCFGICLFLKLVSLHRYIMIICAVRVQERTNSSAYGYFLHYFTRLLFTNYILFLFSADSLKNVESSADRTNPAEVTERIPLLDLYPTQMPHPRTKIKLQLFPINEKMRMAVEKVSTQGQNTDH